MLDGVGDAFFPIADVLVFFLAVGIEDGSAGGDDGAFAVEEGGAGHFGGGALCAVAWQEEDGFWEAFSEAFHGMGLGCADDGAEGAEPAVADHGVGEGGEFVGDHFGPGSAVVEFDILEIGGAGVAGPDEDEQALAGMLGGVEERLEGVEAEHGIGGDGVWGDDFVLVAEGSIGEVSGGVGRGGGSDVAAFDVADDEESEFFGFLDEREVGFDAFRVVFFEIGGLEFDDGDEGRDDFEDCGREIEDGVDGRLGVIGVAMIAVSRDRVGQGFEDRVNSDADGGLFFVDCGHQSVCEMFTHRVTPSVRLDDNGMPAWYNGRRGGALDEVLDEAARSEALPEHVFDMVCDHAVDGIGLVSGEGGQSSGVVAIDFHDVSQDAEDAGVDSRGLGESPRATATDDAAARGDERDGSGLFDGLAALSAEAEFGEVSGFA